MDNVNVYDNDIVEIVDINRLSSFPQTYQETFLEALTSGKRTASINGVLPTVLSIVAPTITITIPSQYFAVEGRVDFHTSVDVPVVHPSPGTTHDFYIYLMLRLDDDTDTRTNVNPVTFAQTTPSRIIANLEVAEYSILDVAGGGGAPVPATGVGVPGAGMERLGYVLRATFSWDGVATAFPVISENAADTVRFGSSGIPTHGGTHVTTDPIPYPTDVNRGVAPPRTLPYWKNSISRVEQASGSPITSVKVGQNGPAGDLNYDVFSAATALGYELDFDFEAASFQIIGNTFTPRFAAPPVGAAGTADTFSRSDHDHFEMETDPQYETTTAVSNTSGLVAPYEVLPTSATPITWGASYANKLVMLQVDLYDVGPDSGNLEDRTQLEIIGSAMTRWVTVIAGGSGDSVGQSTMVIVRANGSGAISFRGHNAITGRFRVAILGTMGG